MLLIGFWFGMIDHQSNVYFFMLKKTLSFVLVNADDPRDLVVRYREKRQNLFNALPVARHCRFNLNVSYHIVDQSIISFNRNKWNTGSCLLLRIVINGIIVAYYLLIVLVVYLYVFFYERRYVGKVLYKYKYIYIYIDILYYYRCRWHMLKRTNYKHEPAGANVYIHIYIFMCARCSVLVYRGVIKKKKEKIKKK